MQTNEGSLDYVRFPKPKIERIEGQLKERLESIIRMKICPLAIREVYEEAGPFGIDMIFFDCKEGGDAEVREGLAGRYPCSIEYAAKCKTYLSYQGRQNKALGDNQNKI